MKLRQSSSPDKKAGNVFRHMGMSLAIIGTVFLATGLAVLWRGAESHSEFLSFSILALGAAMLITGLYIWRTNKT